MKPNRRDERIASDTHADRALMCSATNCPNRWSVDGPRGRCCSAHAWSDRPLWPRITEEQLDRSAQAALARNLADQQAQIDGEGPAKASKLTAEQRRERARQILAKLAMVGQRKTGRGWAQRLRHREDNGFRLTLTQAEMVAAVIGPRPDLLTPEQTPMADEVPA